MTQVELVEAIYSEMAEFGFLTRYIYGDGIEEININSWRDIEVQYSDGRNEKLTEHFDSPEHALAVIRRILVPYLLSMREQGQCTSLQSLFVNGQVRLC